MFQVGDKVKCIRNTEIVGTPLDINKIYTVESTYIQEDWLSKRNLIVLKGIKRLDESPGYIESRFVLYKYPLPENFKGEYEQFTYQNRR